MWPNPLRANGSFSSFVVSGCSSTVVDGLGTTVYALPREMTNKRKKAEMQIVRAGCLPRQHKTDAVSHKGVA